MRLMSIYSETPFKSSLGPRLLGVRREPGTKAYLKKCTPIKGLIVTHLFPRLSLFHCLAASLTLFHRLVLPLGRPNRSYLSRGYGTFAQEKQPPCACLRTVMIALVTQTHFQTLRKIIRTLLGGYISSSCIDVSM